MPSDSEMAAKARAKMEEAEKKLKKVEGFLSSLFGGGSSNLTDAAELFIQAANSFKAAKDWPSAGTAFVKAARLFEKQDDSKHNAAMNYDEAGKCFRKMDIQKSVECYIKTAEIYTDMGRFNMAAKTHMSIAELYEPDGSQKENCMLQYQKAADYFKGEESKSSASKCLIKVAQIAAEMEQYQKAVELFEEVGVYEAEHQTLKYSAKTHFFQALLCYLCIDLLESQRALKRYEELSPMSVDSREFKLIKDLMMALEEDNVDMFTEAVQQHDKISRLDPWHVSLLVKIKRRCGAGGHGGGGEEEDDLR